MCCSMAEILLRLDIQGGGGGNTVPLGSCYINATTSCYLCLAQLTARCGQPQKLGDGDVPPEERESFVDFSFGPIDIEVDT